MYPYAIFFGFGLYDLFFTAGLLSALILGDRMGVRRGFSLPLQKTLLIAAVLGVLGGVGGAVLMQAFYDFLQTGVFKINVTTGMTFYGGLLFGTGVFLAVWFLLGKRLCRSDEPKTRFCDVADIAACVLPLAHGLGRIGCFFAGCCHGKPTEAWYGVRMYTESGWQRVVPTQLFEAVFLLLLSAGLFWQFYRAAKKPTACFPLLPVYCVAYGVWRFFIEYARADDRGATIVSFLTPSQLIAVLLFIGGVTYIALWLAKKNKRKAE